MADAAWAPAVGARVRVAPDGDCATVRYIGAVAGTDGDWVGLEFDTAGRGKHDGVHQGVRYFECSAAAGPQSASFVRPHKLSGGVTLLQALTTKYEQVRRGACAVPRQCPAAAPLTRARASRAGQRLQKRGAEQAKGRTGGRACSPRGRRPVRRQRPWAAHHRGAVHEGGADGGAAQPGEADARVLA
jgi:hypothetical protein